MVEVQGRLPTGGGPSPERISPPVPHKNRNDLMTITAETPVWGTPRGMGGTFTVVLLEDDPACPTVLTRVCYGRLDEAGRHYP